jgi:hypothetical protein
MHCSIYNVVESDNEWKLFLSSYDKAENIDFLQKNNVKHIISLLHREKLGDDVAPNRYDIHKNEGVNYNKYVIPDIYGNSQWVAELAFSGFSDKQNDDIMILVHCIMELYMYIIADFIENCKDKKENVLVHCRSAVSRSPSVIIAYYMIKQNKTLQEAKELLSNITKNAKFSEIWNNNHLWGGVLEEIEKNNLNQNIREILDDKIEELLKKITQTSNFTEMNIEIEKKDETSATYNIITSGLLYEIIKNYMVNTNKL